MSARLGARVSLWILRLRGASIGVLAPLDSSDYYAIEVRYRLVVGGGGGTRNFYKSHRPRDPSPRPAVPRRGPAWTGPPRLSRAVSAHHGFESKSAPRPAPHRGGASPRTPPGPQPAAPSPAQVPSPARTAPRAPTCPRPSRLQHPAVRSSPAPRGHRSPAGPGPAAAPESRVRRVAYPRLCGRSHRGRRPARPE